MAILELTSKGKFQRLSATDNNEETYFEFICGNCQAYSQYQLDTIPGMLASIPIKPECTRCQTINKFNLGDYMFNRVEKYIKRK